jgi:hypothetical protein
MRRFAQSIKDPKQNKNRNMDQPCRTPDGRGTEVGMEPGRGPDSRRHAARRIFAKVSVGRPQEHPVLSFVRPLLPWVEQASRPANCDPRVRQPLTD